MKTQAQTDDIARTELSIKMVLAAWETQNSRVDSLLENVSDEQLKTEIAPGKNRGIYLLGHLAAVSDALLPLFDFGEKLYPQLEEIFLKNPDRSDLETPSIAEIRNYWNEINARLTSHFQHLSVDEWFAKHTAVSEEDFAKEPHRNKLNLLINRTNHQSYHLGQLNLLKK